MDKDVQARNNNLYRIAGIAAAIMLALTVYGVVSGINFYALGAWVALALVCFAAMVLTRRNRRDPGVALMLGVALVLLPFSSLVAQGAGVFLAVIAITFSGLCAYLTLSPRWRIWALLAGGVSAATCLLLDVFGSPARPTPLNFTLTVVITVVVLVLYGIFVLRQFPKFSLREKIIVVSLALTLIPLSILVVVTNRASTDILTQRTGTALKNLADTQARNVVALIEQETRVLDVLAFDTAVVSAVKQANESYSGDANAARAQVEKLDEEWRAADAVNTDADTLVAARLNNAAANVLRRFRASYPENVEVFVTDRYGANVAATNRTSDYNQADEEWWQAAYNNGQGAVYIGQPAFDESSQTNAVNIAVPLYGDDGITVQGILRTTFTIQALSTLLESIRPGQSGHTHVLLPNNHTIGYDQASPHDMASLERIRTAPGDVVEVTSPGIPPRFYSRTTIQDAAGGAAGTAISNLNWTVLVHQNRDEILAPVEAQTRGTIVLALIVALVGGLIAFGGAELLTRPIARLRATAEQVRAGNLQARAPVETQDEIGELAATFNQMTAQLGDLVGNLEQRVTDRTTELESNNAYYLSLQDMSVALLKRREVQALLQDIVERAGDLVGTKNGYVFLLDRGVQEMVMRVGVGAYQEFVGTKARRGVGLAGQVWETGEALAVDDYRKWSGRLADPSRDVLRAVIGVPLKSDEQVVGIIGLAHLEANKRFGPTEVDVLNRFAALAALALDNARLLDDTQREVAQRENTEQFLDSLLESLPTMLFVKEAQNLRFVRWNRAGEQITGRTRQEFLGKSDYDFFPPAEADFFVAKDRETLASGQALDIPEEPIQTLDGSVRWLHTRKVPISGADGKPEFLLGISEDITERKKQDEALRESEERYRDLFENASDLIQSVRADGRYEYVNRKWRETLGYSDQEIESLSFMEVIHPDERQHCLALFGRVMAGETVPDIQTAFITQDGRKIFIEGDTSPRIVDGQVVSTRGIFRDVTERLRVQEQVNIQSAALDNAANTVVITDVNGTIQWANRAFTQASGYSLEEAAGSTPRLIKSGMHDAAFYKNLWDTILAGNVWSGEIINRRKDGTLYYEEMTITPIRNIDNEIFRFVAIKQDISARKQAEDALRRNETLYRSLVDVIPQALTRKDREGHITFGNARYFEDTLLTPEELYGKTDFDFHPRELAEKYWQDDLSVLQDGKTIDTIEPHQRGDGTNILVHVLKTPIRNAAGEIDGMQVMFWDITEEQQRQEEINRQNAYTTALQEISVGLMQRLDVNQVLEDIVARAGQLVGTENGYVFLKEPGQDEMEMRVGIGAYEGFVGRRTRQGVGLAGEVWQKNEPVVVDDYRSYGGRLADPSRDILRAVTGVPLRSGSEVIGIIGLAYLDPERKFGEQEIRVLERFAQLAAIALDNARLYESAQAELSERTRAETALALQLQQTELVNRVTSHAVSFDVDRALGEICADLAAYFHADQAGIALFSDDKQSLTVVAERHPEGSPSVVGYQIPVAGNPSTEIVVETRRPVAFSDAQNDPRLEPIRDLMQTRNTASILIAPLFVREEIIGTVGIDSHVPHEFTDDDLAVVERAALAISTSLENARLYNTIQQELGERTRAEARARQRNIELESLNRVAAAMMSDNPVEVSLTEMAKELVQTFHARNCGIAMLNREGTELVVVADALAQEHEQHAVGIVIPVKGNLSSEYVIENKKSLVITDPQNDPVTKTIHERMRDRRTTCLAIIPLLSGEQVIGTIGLDTTEAERVFTDDEIRVAETMATQMANAIEKRRLLESTQREVVQRTRAEKIQSALFRIADAVNTSPTASDFYATLHALVGELVYAPNMYIALYHPAEDALEFSYFSDEREIPAEDFRRYVPAGKRITTWVVKNGKPLLGDLATLNAMAERGEIELFGSVSFEWLGIPLKRGAETFGMFAVQSYGEAHAYTTDEFELLLTLAPEISNAVTRRQEQEALVRRNRELAVLNRVTQLVSEATDLTGTLGAISREMVDVFGARNCGIALYSPDRTELVVAASATRSPDEPGTVGIRIPIANNLSTLRVLETRRPLVIENAQTDPLTEPIHALMRERSTVGLMIVPLLSGGQVIGTAGIDLDDPQKMFTPQDVALAETMASQMANAIEKQRLFEETSERAAEVTVINELARAMSGELTGSQLFRTVYEYLPRLLPADAFLVWLYDRETGTVTRPALYDNGQFFPDEPLPRLPSGSMARVLETGEPVSLNLSRAEWEQEKRKVEALLGTDVPSASLLFVPLRSGDQVKGVMSVQTYRFDAYNEPQVRLMTSVANHVVSAMDNARLFEQTEQALAEARTLYEIGVRLNAAGSTQEALEAAAGPAIVQGAAGASLLKLHTDSSGAPSELELIAVWPRSERHSVPTGTRVPFDLYAVKGWAENPPEPGVSGDVQNDPNLNAMAREWFERSDIRAWAALPLKVGERWIGFLTLNWAEPREFTDKDMRLYRAVMAQTSTVLDNRALFEQTRVALIQTQDALLQAEQAQDRLNLQYRTAELLANSPGLDDAAEPLLELICRSLRWELGEYWAAEPSTQRLTMQYAWGIDMNEVQAFIHDKVGMVFKYGEGFAGAAWAERQLILSENILTDPRFKMTDTAQAAGLVSALGFPLTGGDRVFGVAVFFSNHVQKMDELMLATMTGVGNQIVQFLERRRAEQAIRQQNTYLTALHDTTLGLMRRLNLNELLENIITRAGELIGTEHGYVHLAETSANELRMRVGIGLYQEFIGTRVKPGQGLAGTVWQTSEPIVVDDYRYWQGRLPMVDRDVLRAVVGVPLKSGDQTVGVLGLASLEEGRVFTPAQVEALERFAELAAVALDNAQLYESTQSALQQTRRAAERDKQISEITDRLYSAPDINLVLQAAAEELQRSTGSKRAVVRLNLQGGESTNGNDKSNGKD